jgi:hypothetical protein
MKMYLQEITCRAWSGLIWLKTETSSELMLTRSWNSGFRKMQDIVWLRAELLSSQKRLLGTKLQTPLCLCSWFYQRNNWVYL